MMLAIGRSEMLAPGWRLVMWAGMAALLFAPLVTMQFTREVRWDRHDFAVAAVLLVSIGAAIELALRLFRRPLARALGVAAVVAAGVVICAEGAVGIFS